jgi:1,4-dihydroxy-2-naphthoate octaprenyltransferase
MSLQIGANFANDYFDYMKCADTASRKGPLRAVQGGLITPLAMRNAAYGALTVAALFSVSLLWRIGFSYFPLMLLCLLSALLYTGGKKPLGYLGLGDLLVLVFYGPVATCFTVLALTLSIPIEALIASLAPGFLSCAILTTNNLRDKEEDMAANKMTLIARFGESFGKWEYTVCLFVAFLVPLLLMFSFPWTLATWLLLPLTKEPLTIVWKRKAELNRALPLTARLLALYTLVFCAALYL